MRKFLWTISLCLVVSPLIAQSDQSFEQTQFDAIFLVGESSVTAMYSFSYVHGLGEIRWLFPIPPDATRLEFGSAQLIALLQDQSAPFIYPPPGECVLNPTLSWGYGGLIGDYLSPDNAEVKQVNSLAEALGWLGDSPQDTASLSAYETFAAVSFTQEQDLRDLWAIDVNSSPLLIVEYPGTELFLPIQAHSSQLTTVVTSPVDDFIEADTMPVTAYVFADQPYAPENYDPIDIDLMTITDGNNIAGIMYNFVESPESFDYDYYRLVRQGLDEVSGRGMVTEYRQSPDWNIQDSTRERLPEESALLDSWQDDYAVLTRIRTYIDENSRLPDPQFEVAPQLDLMRINLSTTADPAWFYGCTTRRLYDPELESRLPSERTYSPALQMDVAHPEGWSLYELDERTYAFSPEAVTRFTLSILESSGEGPPMLVLQHFEQEFVRSEAGDAYLPRNTWEPFASGSSSYPHLSAARNAITLYFPSTGGYDPERDEPYGTAEGVRAAVVSTHADFVLNEPLYVDMLAYLATRQFWLSPDLRHTLFMEGQDNLVAIGYPEGWIEMLDARRLRVIAPVDILNIDEGPYIREVIPPVRDTADIWVHEHFGLDDDADLRVMTPFQANGRQGFVQRTDFFNKAAIEISAPDGLYDDYATLLETIAQSMQVSYRD